MITALISAFAGLVSGVVPDVMKEIKDTRAHSREIQFLELNQKLALERSAHETSVKIEDARAKQAVAEIEAGEKQFQVLMAQAMQPTGIAWVDGLNAAIRPVTTIVFLVLFAVGLVAYTFGFSTNDAFGAQMTALFGEAITAVMGYMFGFRSYRTMQPKGA
jgi:hypothetical protein